jgi:hypothetical protein
MIFFGITLALCFAVSILYSYRNDLVFRVQRRSIDIVFDRGLDEANLRVYDYTAMIWQLHKWQFKDFYPHLAEYDK